MLILGLTGGIASGKSTVSQRLRDLNIPVIDADEIARKVVNPYSSVWKKLVAEFGSHILEPLTNEIDRTKLGAIVFSDVAARKKLNSIIHPAIMWEIVKQTIYCYIKGCRMVVWDIPLLFETSISKLVGKTVVIFCPREVQFQRLVKRDLLDPNTADMRINSQISLEEKCKKADFVIDNSGSIEETLRLTEKLVNTIQPSIAKTLFWLSLPFTVVSFCAAFVFYRIVK